jgi:hypothetical protein
MEPRKIPAPDARPITARQRTARAVQTVSLLLLFALAGQVQATPIPHKQSAWNSPILDLNFELKGLLSEGKNAPPALQKAAPPALPVLQQVLGAHLLAALKAAEQKTPKLKNEPPPKQTDKSKKTKKQADKPKEKEKQAAKESDKQKQADKEGTEKQPKEKQKEEEPKQKETAGSDNGDLGGCETLDGATGIYFADPLACDGTEKDLLTDGDPPPDDLGLGTDPQLFNASFTDGPPGDLQLRQAAVPEPASLGLALAGLVAWRRSRQRAAAAR